MQNLSFSETDRQQLATLGITANQVQWQLQTFRRASFQLRLLETCTVDNGIHRMGSAEQEKYIAIQQKAAEQGRFLKFIPASGAATRMFRSLFKIRQPGSAFDPARLRRAVQEGDPAASDFARFLEHLPEFAFYDTLAQRVRDGGDVLDELQQRGDYPRLLDYLLGAEGLHYGALAKGLLEFHRYESCSRTAFEEHLVEAAHYVRDGNDVCRLHFTVSEDHREDFEALLKEVRTFYEERYRIQLRVTFSRQKHSTDTIAVDLSDRPLRDSEGRLIFRPGGHGSLLENLEELHQDLVYIKNIDNVVPDRLKEPTILWKKVLGGYLVKTQEKVHHYLHRLTTDRGDALEATLQAAADFAGQTLCVRFPAAFAGSSAEQRRAFLLEKLDRPIRVCGVVPNTGEPGGAPFWVKDRNGLPTLQIVEKAQVDHEASEQEAIWSASTHFNPVDIVCGLRDHTGRPFDLKRYVDPQAVFISKKSSGGKDLKALELPGLWNGAMADWNSLFVEVPPITFNPVKTVFDLLRPAHQPE